MHWVLQREGRKKQSTNFLPPSAGVGQFFVLSILIVVIYFMVFWGVKTKKYLIVALFFLLSKCFVLRR